MTSSSANDPKRDFLRHTLATVAYRGSKMLRDAPATFGDFRPCDSSRTPRQILSHISDLMEWALSMSQGKQHWHVSEPMTWDKERERFHSALERFDDFLASSNPLQAVPENLFQGPIADALTHVGQIAMLRRIAATPVKSENYFIADVSAGRVGASQAAPKFEFD
jgi:hypothetical protein